MIRTLRIFFLGRLLREKLLLLVFLLFAVIWWASAFAQRAAGFVREQSATTRQLEQQKTYIDNQQAVLQLAEKAAKSLEPGLTLDGPRLVNAINQAANEAGLKNPQTTLSSRQSSGEFTINTAQFQVVGATGDAIEKFYNNLQKRAPYLSIEQFALQANQRDPSQFNLALTISSVEIAR